MDKEPKETRLFPAVNSLLVEKADGTNELSKRNCNTKTFFNSDKKHKSNLSKSEELPKQKLISDYLTFTKRSSKNNSLDNI